MSDDTESLPEDPAELRALLLSARTALKLRDLEIEHLKAQLATLRRRQFGRSSEQLGDEIKQLELRLQALDPDAEFPFEKPATIANKLVRQKPSRRPLPPHLPRETRRHPTPTRCPDCGGSLKSIGEDIREVLEYIPAHFKVIRYIRPKCSCAHCQTLIQPAAVAQPIARGRAGPQLLAQVLVSKYADHLPLYRQSTIYQRAGVGLPRSTLADWVGQLSNLLAPLGAALAEHALAGPTLHADDTPLPVLAPGSGVTKTARLWAYVRDERPAGQTTAPAVWFQYSPDRQGRHPQTHLKHYQGALHADGYAGFNALYHSGKVEEVACWAHVRRKFYDIQQATDSTIAAEAVARIAELYAIEKGIRGQPPEKRRLVRQARAGPLLGSLKTWLEQQLSVVSAKSTLAQAIGYALPRWTALTRYLNNGRLEIDNNAAERAIRPLALGRKNYLFAGSDAGGESAALMYSLIGTARLHDLDPQTYLAYVIERIAEHPINQVSELLPWQVAEILNAQQQQAA